MHIYTWDQPDTHIYRYVYMFVYICMHVHIYLGPARYSVLLRLTHNTHTLLRAPVPSERPTPVIYLNFAIKGH